MDLKKQIGENIKKIRLEKDLKQEAFAHELNKNLKTFNINGMYNSKSISNWENGVSIPKIEVLIVLSKCYNLSLDELLKDKMDSLLLKRTCGVENSNYLTEKILNSPNVCKAINGKRVSSWNENKYNYGMLSYLASNIVMYRGNLGKVYKVSRDEKLCCIITSILTNENGKVEYHGLGNKENDIIDVVEIPENYDDTSTRNEELFCSLKKYCAFYNIIKGYLIKLGNGKIYRIDANKKDKINPKFLTFNKDNMPDDLQCYVSAENSTWTDYCDLKGMPNSTEFYEVISGGGFYDKDADIYVSQWDVELNISDNQLVQILVDDYKMAIQNKLTSLSDMNMGNKNIKEKKI